MRKITRRRKVALIETKPSESDLTVHEIEDDGDIILLKHRTCWIHLIECIRTCKTKISRKELITFQLNAPCFLDFPHRVRSPRKVKCKYATSKLKMRLNCNVFTNYLENIWSSFSEDQKHSVTYLDPMYFVMYTDENSKDKVLSWIKDKHIFSKKYVFVPIVLWGHWNLLIFCNFAESVESREPCMLLLDSLQMAGPSRYEQDIRRFVFDIFEAEGRTESKRIINKIPLLVPKVPQQRNDEECGSFVLYFINLFMKDAPRDFSRIDYPYFMRKDWFHPEDFDEFCKKLDSVAD